MSDSSSKEKTWRLAALTVAREAEQAISALLFDLGTSGVVTLEESDATVELGAYFDEQRDAQELARLIEAALERAELRDALKGVEVSDVADQDWMQKWKEGFEAIEVGERLIVAPSWKLPDNTSGRAVIQIDPGMAFGTGTHETTRLCLEAIERYWRGATLLDVGTGTGILAIAAALLEPHSHAVAIDVDPLAVEVARENIAINGVSDSVEALEAQPRDYAGRAFDAVVANLTAEVIAELMSDLVSCLATTGTMILSGILTALREDVERACVEAGLIVIERREAGEWAALVAQRGAR